MTSPDGKWRNYDWMDNPFWAVMMQIWAYIGPFVKIFLAIVLALFLILNFGFFGIIAVGILGWVWHLLKQANQDAMGNV